MSASRPIVNTLKSPVREAAVQRAEPSWWRSQLSNLVAVWCLLGLLAARATADEDFPPKLVQFVPAAINPVFEGRGPGYWDAKIRERGWIMHEESQWFMWYTGYDGRREGQKKLGYATSSDGLNWKRNEQPIYDEHWVEDMMVVKEGKTYYMFAEGLNDQAQLLTSTDRLHWTRVGTLDIRYKKDGSKLTPGPFGTPVGWFENGTWYLFYERGDAAVWLATSTDLKVFTNVQDEPVMTPGPQDHDRDMIAFNQIVKRGPHYYAYYHGASKATKPAIWTTSIAVSEDLVRWRKYAGNPLMLDNKSSGILLDGGSAEKPELRLYTMHDKVQVHYGPSHRETTRQLPDGRIVIDSQTLNLPFNFTRPGTYSVSAIHAGKTAAGIDLQLGDDAAGAVHGELSATGSDQRFVTQPLGKLKILKPGAQSFSLKPGADASKVHEFRALVLTPVGEGAPIKQAEDGVVTCHARDVTIHGVKVQYEPKPEKNTVGYWVNVGDWVSWDFALTKPGTYQVEVLQGCGKGQGGSDVHVVVAGQTLKFTVEDTGHFQNFVPRIIGTVKLEAAGDFKLAIKPQRKAKDAVMDVRQVRLIPVEAKP